MKHFTLLFLFTLCVSQVAPSLAAQTSETNARLKAALQKYPEADTNKDGILTMKEGRAFQAKMKAGDSGKAAAGKFRAPDHANVAYGPHERNVFDIWFADAAKKTPLAIYIHGGGFKAGSKEKLDESELNQLLAAGISVAAINYRYISNAPLPAAHNDAKKALQFIRSKAQEWKIDKDRIAAFGGSAGAQICMWLAFSDEMADPKSENPIERESTRLTCVATSGGQTSNERDFYIERIGPLLGEGKTVESLVKPLGGESDPEKVRVATWGAATLEEADQIAKRHTALELISADDPPIFMKYSMSPSAQVPGDPKRVRGWLIHHVVFGTALKEKTDALNLEAHLKYPGAETKYESQVDFFMDKLLEK